MFSEYGELRPTNGWDRLVSLGYPSIFQWVSHLGFVTAPTSLNEGQPNFAQCLPHLLDWYTIYTFLETLVPNGILPRAKFTLCPSLAFFYIGSITARHSSSGCQPNFAESYKEWNYGTFAPHHLQQRAPSTFRGQPSRWA